MLLACGVIAGLFVDIANLTPRPQISRAVPVQALLPTKTVVASQDRQRVSAPPKGRLYHGFHPGGEDGDEAVVLTHPDLIQRYANRVGHKPWFTYFSHEWRHDPDRATDVAAHKFPLESIRRIAREGTIPFIRLMLRTSSDEAKKNPEKYFTLANIVGNDPQNSEQHRITKEIRTDLSEWGRVARETYRGPLIVEFGTEANNKTFHWNADNQPMNHRDATALFRKAFRYVVRTVSGGNPEESNMVWVFHVTADSDPDTKDQPDDWNKMADYYPDGMPDEDKKDVVDWLGVSIYGVDNLDTGECSTFASQLNSALGKTDGSDSGEKLLALAQRDGKSKPIFILEFGTALNYERNFKDHCVPNKWIAEAFHEIFARAEAGTISGFSWWNERYEHEGKRRKMLELRFDQLELPTPGRRPNDKQRFNQLIVNEYSSKLSDRRVIHQNTAR